MIKVRAPQECALSKGTEAATLSGVATSALGPKNSRSRKLKDTLGELESALSDWDRIIPPAADEIVASGTPRSRPHSGMPEEMKRRTRELLNQLKEQIDELSTEEKPVN